MKALISIISFAILLVTTFGQVQAEPARAWGWFDQPTSSSSTLNAAYQFNSKGGALTGQRIGKGNYKVRIPNMGSNYAGAAHAVAYGGNHSVQVVSWGSEGSNLVINVKAFDSAGSAKDGQFVILFYKEDNASGAYTWVNGTGTVSHGYKDNSAGGAITVSKSTPGRYQVIFKGVKPDTYTGKKGTVLVTPYGSIARRARVLGWGVSPNGDATINVQMTDMNGTPKDSRFVVSFINDFNIGQAGYGEASDYGAFVWGNNAIATSPYTPRATYSKNNASSTIKITKIGTGAYKVTLGGVKHVNSSMAIATAYGQQNTYATVSRWYKNPTSGTDVFINTYDANGNPKNSQFNLFYYTNQNILY